MGVKVTWRRRDSVWGGLALLSGLYLLGAWAWTNAQMQGAMADGVDPITATIHANGFVLEATYAWVTGALAVHLVLALWAWRARDREVAIGAAISLAAHVVLWWAYGIVAL